MLKALSAMVDNFDTQMADYMADIDMQAFSSDPWLHDEVKMEEDAPGLKLENFSHAKDDGHDQGDLTIEIDMEDHSSVEYDMVDDEQPPEILDVEVYDASLAQSPAMASFDSVLTESSFSALAVPPTGPQETDVTTAAEPTLPAEFTSASVTSPALAPVHEEIVAVPVLDSPQNLSHTDETSHSILSTHEYTHAVEPLDNAGSAPLDPEFPSSTDALAERVEERSQEHASERSTPIQLHSVEDLNSTIVAPDEGPSGGTELPETADAGGPHVESTSAGDPHEISEGVYIDPPPAVLLTISSDDHEYELSLFNEPAEWQLPSTEHHADAHRTLLHQLPTMYYESLFSLFEALRQDEFIQSVFHLSEVELVLQAGDLALTISEDNVYSRDVSLHDLNMLHDGSAIGGPLRMKLYASSPRFIVQYHQLQEHVSRLQLSHTSRGDSFGTSTENQAPYSGHAIEEGEPEAQSTEPLADEEKNEELEEPAETETHFPQQNSEPEHHEEAQHEGENSLGQTAENEGDKDSPSDEEESPTDSYPTVEDNGRKGQFAHIEADTAVIGLDILEAEVIELQRTEDEHHETSAFVHDGLEEDDENGPGNEQELDDSPQDDERDDISSQAADRKGEVNQEPEEGGDEQGDEISDEQSEYAEPEAEPEPLPDQFQALPQVLHDEHDRSEDTTPIEHTTLSDNAAGQEYNEEVALPELPTDPISFDDEDWTQELKQFENVDETLNDGDENEHSLSNHSSVTLSSRGSKRTYDDYESGGEGYDDEEQQWELPSPDPKRTRTQ